jgi:hypothetical protein
MDPARLRYEAEVLTTGLVPAALTLLAYPSCPCACETDCGALRFSASSVSLRLADVIAMTHSSISDWDDASTRKVRFLVTIPKVNECFLILTAAAV